MVSFQIIKSNDWGFRPYLSGDIHGRLLRGLRDIYCLTLSNTRRITKIITRDIPVAVIFSKQYNNIKKNIISSAQGILNQEPVESWDMEIKKGLTKIFIKKK